MSDKIAKDAAARAQAIHAAVTNEGKPPVEPPVNPENPGATGLEGQNNGVTLPEDPALLRAEAGQWKQRYQVLKGKYDAEVPRLTEQLRAAQARVQELESLQQQASKTTLDGALATVREELGDKVADALAQFIQNPNAPVSVTPAPPAAAPAAPADQGQDPEQEHPYFAHVREMVDAATGRPGTFDTVNFDPTFIGYLTQTVHQPTGLSLKAFMDQQFAAGELADVARVFLSFVNKRAKDAQDDANKRKQGAASPDVPAAAGKGGAADEKPTYTRAEYDATMKSLLHDKKYRTPEGIALANTVRNELLEALRDGRVIG